MRTRRLSAVLALSGLAATASLVVAAPAAGAGDLLAPADGIPRATLTRTSYGIPHIEAGDYLSLAFGQGYAASEDILCSLADTLVTGRGERSRYFGPDERYNDQVTLNATNLQTDTLFRNLRDRKVVEALLDDPQRGPGEEVRAMVRGYVLGVNHYLDSVGGADGVTDPACKGAEHVRKAEPIDLYYGIYAANLLASAGVFVPQIADASPPSPTDLGLPVGPSGFAPVPDALPTAEQLQTALGRDTPFGSNGTALSGDATATGQGMVLGNPHFPWRGRYRFTQSHLTIPGVYDVAGGMLHGAPVVNIGWNSDVAWTHTVSTAYRFTPYEYRLVAGAPTTYLTESGPKDVQRDEVRIQVKNADGSLSEVVEDIYRTDEGYVLDAPALLMGWTPASVFAIREANGEHLRTLDVFHEMAKAKNVRELVEAHGRTGGMPWVNTLSADRHGDAVYADHSVVPNVPNSMLEGPTSCLSPIGAVLFELAGLPGLDGTRASGDCAWRTDDDASRPGIFGPSNLPETFDAPWVINANDSYWLPNPEHELEGFARIIGCERCLRSLRTRMMYRYMLDRFDGSDGLTASATAAAEEGSPNLFTHEQLKATQHENRVFAAELAREDDDLQTVCASADGGPACDVLKAWTGRDDIDAEGSILFREFWNRLPANRWEVPFDASDPVNTPRDLREDDDAVVAAFESALAFLDEKGVAVDDPLGSQQVAGDDHAPRIPVGGGPHSTGNANVVGSSDPGANLEALYPISFGSSHIQAVAFTDTGVSASTILTYGQSIDPRRNHADQTALFSQEKWVDFPFTAAEIEADRQSRIELVGPPLEPASEDQVVDARPVPATGTLPATGGTAGLAGVAALAALAGGALLRRRRA